MIIGISGYKRSGKSTVANIIQYLIWKDKVEKRESNSIHYSINDFLDNDLVGFSLSKWEIKQFSTPIKNLICGRLNVTRDWLERNKETKLEKWNNLTPREMMQFFHLKIENELHSEFWCKSEFELYNNNKEYINWIFTDVRDPNKKKLIKDTGGITIRVNKRIESIKLCDLYNGKVKAETLLDNETFDYVVDNNGTIQELVIEVEKILIDLKIIK